MSQAIHLSGRPTSPQGQALSMMHVAVCLPVRPRVCVRMYARVHVCTGARVWVCVRLAGEHPLIAGDVTKNTQRGTGIEEKASGWDRSPSSSIYYLRDLG